MYLNSPAFVRVKGGENKCFRIDSGLKQGCIMSNWLPKVYGYNDERNKNCYKEEEE